MKHRLQDTFFSSLSRITKRYSLRIQSGGCGLFGDFFMALNGLRFCHRTGVQGYPDWRRRSLYYDEAKGGNAWDYFFAGSEPAMGRGACFAFELPYWPSATGFVQAGQLSPRENASRAIQQFGRPLPELVAKADEFAKEQWGDRSNVLGVHVRATDAASGTENRKTASIEMFENEIDSYLSSNNESVVFLATDAREIVTRITNRYGDRVVSQSCLRSNDGTSVHGHYDGGVTGNPYTKGVEAVTDSTLLSKCDFLIRGHSRLTCFSLCYNPKLKYIDVERKYLGIDRTPWLHESPL